MDRDPLALPGDPGYKSEPDSDVEVIASDSDEVELMNSSTVLKVELVPADMNYVKKLITGNKRGRKRKDDTKVITTGDTHLNVQVIRPSDVTRNESEEEETESDEKHVKVNGRGRPKQKILGRPRKKKKPIENEFKPNPKSTHHSRSSRYQQLQEKKDEFLQQESARKAAYKEKYRKHIERAKEKYREKKAAEQKAEKILFPFQKKLHRKMCMLAIKIRHLDKSKSKEELVKEMAVEWKTDRQAFWENYNKRWKEVAFRSVKPMTEERAEFLRKRGQQYDQLKQEQSLMLNRVSTRNGNKSKEDFVNSPGSSMMGYQGESNDGVDDMISYEEFLDEEFVGTAEDIDNGESLLFAMSQEDEDGQELDETLSQQEVEYDYSHHDEYQTSMNDEEIPLYYDEGVVDVEEFPTQDLTHLNGFS